MSIILFFSPCHGLLIEVMVELCAFYWSMEQTLRYTPMMARHQVILPTPVSIIGLVTRSFFHEICLKIPFFKPIITIRCRMMTPCLTHMQKCLTFIRLQICFLQLQVGSSRPVKWLHNQQHLQSKDTLLASFTGNKLIGFCVLL